MTLPGNHCTELCHVRKVKPAVRCFRTTSTGLCTTGSTEEVPAYLRSGQVGTLLRQVRRYLSRYAVWQKTNFIQYRCYLCADCHIVRLAMHTRTRDDTY